MKHSTKMILIGVLSPLLLFAVSIPFIDRAAIRADRVIAAIGDVTLDSGTAIEQAKEAAAAADYSGNIYKMRRLDELYAAEAAYRILLAEDAIEHLDPISLDSQGELSSIERIVRKLSEEERSTIKNIDEYYSAIETYDAMVVDANVDAVNQFIANLSAVTIENGSEIDTQYRAMKRLKQSGGYERIDNPTKQINAYNKYEALLIEEKINDIGEVTTD